MHRQQGEQVKEARMFDDEKSKKEKKSDSFGSFMSGSFAPLAWSWNKFFLIFYVFFLSPLQPCAECVV